MALKLSNNAISQLASSITAAATSITLKTGDGAKFPTLDAVDYHPATISKPDGTFEIVRVTARSGDTLTVTRAQEGTTALSFSGGNLIELRLTAGIIETFASLTDTQTLVNKTITDPTIIGTILEDVYTITDGASVDIDPGNGSVQVWTLGASRTPTATNFAAGESVTLMIADGTAYAVTWTTIGVVWTGGSAPTLPISGYGVVVLWKIGSTIYGKSVGDVA